jgi:TonB-dependent SusC/RagA subfamily outer membrane receptor
MSHPMIIRGGLLARIGLLHALVGVVSSAGCYRAPTPAHQAAPVDRPTTPHVQQPTDAELHRRFSGVVVARTAKGGLSIRPLGATVGGGPPLYLIDGAPVLADPSRGFDWLKPEDVERITVLRDPAQTAVYGPRGVNGVILVTTKQAQTRRSRAP